VPDRGHPRAQPAFAAGDAALHGALLAPLLLVASLALAFALPAASPCFWVRTT
jgi:hypothetical protein